jgi:signal transduction histidine kinase
MDRVEGGIDELLEALGSTRWVRARDAVEELGARLRDGTLPQAELPRVAERLVGLASNEKWEIRKAVAHAAEHLPLGPFHSAVVSLLDDEHALVQEAARRALARRTELTRADPLTEQHEDLLAGWLSELDERHDPKTRDAALAVARRYAEALVREAYHEIVRVLSPLELSLKNVDALLKKKPVARTQCQERVKRAREQVALLTGIVSSLRDMTTEVTAELRPEKLRDMVADAVEIVRERRPDRARGLAVTLGVDAEQMVVAHRHRIVQAFANVVENAVDAYDGTSKKPRITVSSRAEEHEVTIEIRDRGCGMNEEAVQDAFRLFSTSKPDGTGVGLPLARKIVQSEHRGRIWLESKPGEGTTVTVVLPSGEGAGE